MEQVWAGRGGGIGKGYTVPTIPMRMGDMAQEMREGARRGWIGVAKERTVGALERMQKARRRTPRFMHLPFSEAF
jgi:hypothetical protein